MMFAPGSASAPVGRAPEPFQSVSSPSYTGHAHFWERAVSRRRFMMTAAGATAAAAGAQLLLPGLAAAAAGRDPRPIPGGLEFLGSSGPLFHAFFPAFGQEVSTITDFRGLVAAAEIQGSGTTNDNTRLTFDADMRFMHGVYTDLAGRTTPGTFGFI